MAAVPFVPVPTVKNTDASGAQFSVPNANAQAFGAGVGAALENLGHAGQHASEALEHQVVTFQNDQNETDVNKATVDFDTKVAQEQLRFSSLSGQDAVNDLPNYQKNLQTMREEAIAAAPNSAVSRMLDQHITRQVGTAIIAASRHAGQQNRAALNASRSAIIQTSQASGGSAPDDQFESTTLPTIEKNATLIANQQYGNGPEAAPQRDAYVKTQTGLAWQNRITTKAMVDPYTAKTDLVANKDKMTPEQFSVANEAVNRSVVTLGPRQIADSTSPVNAGRDALRNAAKINESGGNYGLVHAPAPNGDRAIGAYGIMSANIPSWTKEVLGKSMTPEEFRRNPAAQDAVFDAKFGQAVKKYGTVADAASVWFTGRPFADGMTLNDGQTTGKAYVIKFLKNLNTAGIGQDSQSPKVMSPAQVESWVEKGRAEAQRRFPENPDIADATEHQIRQGAAKQVAASTEYKTQKFQSVQSMVMGGASGNKPTTLDEMVAGSQDGQRAVLSLTPEYQTRVQKALRDNAAGKTFSWNPENTKRYQELQGMAVLEPEKFKNELLVDEEMPDEAKQKLMKLQQKPGDNTAILKAVSVLNSHGFFQQTNLKRGDPAFPGFVGSLNQSLQEYAAKNPQAPNMPESEILKLMPQLVKNIPTDQTGTVPAPGTQTVEQQMQGAGVPMTALTVINQKFQEKYGKLPTAEEVKTLYFASPALQKKYGNKQMETGGGFGGSDSQANDNGAGESSNILSRMKKYAEKNPTDDALELHDKLDEAQMRANDYPTEYNLRDLHELEKQAKELLDDDPEMHENDDDTTPGGMTYQNWNDQNDDSAEMHENDDDDTPGTETYAEFRARMKRERNDMSDTKGEHEKSDGGMTYKQWKKKKGGTGGNDSAGDQGAGENDDEPEMHENDDDKTPGGMTYEQWKAEQDDSAEMHENDDDNTPGTETYAQYKARIAKERQGMSDTKGEVEKSDGGMTYKQWKKMKMKGGTDGDVLTNPDDGAGDDGLDENGRPNWNPRREQLEEGAIPTPQGKMDPLGLKGDLTKNSRPSDMIEDRRPNQGKGEQPYYDSDYDEETDNELWDKTKKEWDKGPTPPNYPAGADDIIRQFNDMAEVLPTDQISEMALNLRKQAMELRQNGGSPKRLQQLTKRAKEMLKAYKKEYDRTKKEIQEQNERDGAATKEMY